MRILGFLAHAPVYRQKFCSTWVIASIAYLMEFQSNYGLHVTIVASDWKIYYFVEFHCVLMNYIFFNCKC
ncbi:hypothetical protein HanIR_Chr02g0066921 [Helianthus annuus]|nr:hypothetical protein HanIR_Chr02g0066921 [Helianthus annuus]